jgi:hypothetical protein
MPAFRELPSGASRWDNARHALLGTLPGRAIVIGIVLRLSVYAAGLALGTVPPFLSVIDTAAGLALAIGAVYIVFRLVVLGKRHLLWRVRRKLMLSYVFVGFFPATLIVVFFLLCGFLLFYNFSSYLVQSHLRALADQASFLAVAQISAPRATSRHHRRRQAPTGEMAACRLRVRPSARAPAVRQTASPRVSSRRPGHAERAARPGWID